jgi:hypothetical protein
VALQGGARLAFVQGRYLNEKVNSERTDFSIPKDGAERAASIPASDASTSELFPDEITLSAVREGALAGIRDDLKVFIDEINSQKEVALNSYVAEEGPQYRVLLKYKDDFINDIPPQASKTEMEMALHRQLYQRQTRLKQEGAERTSHSRTCCRRSALAPWGFSNARSSRRPSKKSGLTGASL